MFRKLKALTAGAAAVLMLGLLAPGASTAYASGYLQGNQSATGVLSKGGTATASYEYNPYQDGYFTVYVSCSSCSYQVVDEDGYPAFNDFRTESPNTYWGRSDTNYYIQLTSGSTTKDDNYYVWVSDSIPDTRENDNDPYWATPIQAFTPLSSYMIYSGDVDYYGYKPTQSVLQTVTLNRSEGLSSLYSLYVYDAQHNMVAFSEDIADPTTELNFPAVAGQWYFIGVMSDDLDYTPYTVQVNPYQGNH